MEIDFRELTEHYLKSKFDLSNSYYTLTGKSLLSDDNEHDRLVMRYLEWLLENNVSCPKTADLHSKATV